jgi:hypothetical protein
MPDLRIPFEGSALESIRTRMNATGQTFDNYDEDVRDDEVRDAREQRRRRWRGSAAGLSDGSRDGRSGR